MNDLVSLSGFVIKIATQDYHPAGHISFASNHSSPDDKPFESSFDMRNWVAGREGETVRQRLWPVHCVQGTKGAEFVDEFDDEKVDVVVRKGMDERAEMYSVFADAFGNFNCVGTGVSHDCVELLKAKDVSHVFVVGLAGDYCVKHTALDAAKAGFEVCVVEEATRCVDSGEEWVQAVKDFDGAGVQVVSFGGAEVERVKLMC